MKKLVLLACVLLLCVASGNAQFLFTNIDCPEPLGTTARGINNHGEIVGRHRGPEGIAHATLIKAGECIELTTNPLPNEFSEAFKSNDSGDIAGFVHGDDSILHGFFLNKHGVLTTLDFPGAGQTYPLGINQSDTVVGGWDVLDPMGNLVASHGFTWNNGRFSQVDYPYPPPGSGDTNVIGISPNGDMVGWWDMGAASTIGHGFVRPRNGQFITFDVPVAGATYTELNDINSHGQMVGLYIDAGGVEHGLMQVGAAFTSIDFPASIGTEAWGINDASQIVGNHFVSSDSRSHGFLAVPVATQAMEGDLRVRPGDTLSAGYDFTIPCSHAAASVQFTSATATFQAKCVSGSGGGSIVVALTDGSYSDPANSGQWLPSGDQHSSLVYQGSVSVPNLCAGGQMSLKNGGTFSAQVQSTDSTDAMNIRWHYSARGSAGGWSGTLSFIPF